jgi:hypothetical protein
MVAFFNNFYTENAGEVLMLGFLTGRRRSEKKLPDYIVERLRALDYFPQLEIVEEDICICRHVFLSDGGRSSRPKNPTAYLVNSALLMSNLGGDYSYEVKATVIAMIAINKRANSGDDKIEPFPLITVSEAFSERISSLCSDTWDEYEAHAEIIGRIAGAMKFLNYPDEEIASVAKMPASAIVEKLGVAFIEEAMWI